MSSAGKGGGWFSPYTWSRDTETDGQHDNCQGSSGQPGTLLKIIKHFQVTAISKYTLYIIIFTGEDNKARIDSQQYVHELLGLGGEGG